MKSFKDFLIEEKKIKTLKPVVIAFGRFNPPHIGHEQLIKHVLKLAKKNNAIHEVILTGTHDLTKNPLSQDKKLGYLQKMFPNINFVTANGAEPTIIHHVKRLSKAGHDHLIVVAGPDKVNEYRSLLNKYNGKDFAFKKINVLSAGQRPEIEPTVKSSSTQMREYAKNNDLKSFQKGLPKHLDKDFAKYLMDDIRRGMNL